MDRTFDGRRRGLLAGMAAVGAGMVAPVAVPAAGTQKLRGDDGRVGVAIVGVGGYGQLALERLAQSRIARPAALVSGSRGRALEQAARYGIPADAVYGYDEYARLAGDGRVDAVHLCLPVGLHKAHALSALAAGKHVLCEKPLAGSVADAKVMVEAATAAGRILMPAYRAWFSEAIQSAIARCRAGDLGGLVSIDAHKGFAMRQPAGNWRFDPALSGGGCLPDIGIYSVQLQRWLAGALPLRVSARQLHADDPRYRRTESDIAWLAEFPGGVLATGSASWRYRLQNRARVGFAEGWLDLDPATPTIGERMRLGLDSPNRVEEPALPPRDQIPRMYDAFAEACLGRNGVPVSASDGIDDLRMIEAIYRAASTGGTVEL